MALIAHNQKVEIPAYSTAGPVFTSVLFHIVLFLLTLLSVPFVAKDPLVISKPINIEIVTVSDKNQTTRLASPVKKKEKKEEPSLKKKNISKKMTASMPPDLSVPAPPKLEQKKIPTKPKNKPKIKPKKKIEPKKQTLKKQSDLFSSLLKNLAPDAKDVEEAPETQEEKKEETSKISQIAALGETMSISEMEAFKQQISPCWNVSSSAKFAENLIVEIRVFMNPDKSLQSASILDQVRYTLDAHFRAAADSALRALRNPRCQPFSLPAEKYEQWKVMVIRFDPKDML